MNKNKTVHLSPEIHKKIKHLAADNNSNIQYEVNKLLMNELEKIKSNDE